MTKVRAQNVYKVFGRRETEAVKRLNEGATAQEVKNLGTAAVIDASFDVNEGEIFVVMGLSGSGKSTLIRMLNGLWKPSSGSVFVEDTDLAKASDSELREIRRDKASMVFQHFALMPHRTVRENAGYALEVNGVPKAERNERADKWLDTVGLGGWGDKYPGQLSGGMQQRVGLARALAAETDILLMDEAFSALDPLIRREMQEQLVELQSTLGKTIIFITHDLNEAMYVGDRIAVMRDGRIVQIGTAEQILTDPANDYVAQFVQDVDRTRVLTASSVMERPAAVVSSNAGPRRVVEEMRKNQLSGVLVTSRDRKLLGYVGDDDAIAAARKNVTSIEGLIRTDLLNTVPADTPLVGLFAPASGSPIPLAVVDEQGRLRGVIPRVALLASMANLSNGDGQVEVVDENGRPHTGVPVESDGAPTGDAPQDLEPTAAEVHS